MAFSIISLPRLAFAAATLFLATLILSPLVIIASLLFSEEPAFRLARLWATIVAKGMGITFSFHGTENITPGTSYIVTPNHQSNADILGLLSKLPVKFRWVIKKELLRVPLFGHALSRTGAIALDRSDRTQAVSKLQQGESKLKDGWSILIYPEGTRTSDGNIQSFKKGGFMMAVHTGIPILPVTCNGAFKILPKKTIWLRPGHISFTIGAPIPTAGLTEADVPDLMEKTSNAIMEHFDPDYDPFARNGIPGKS
ncbi:lysophospholipid acyltransferase family protein [Desulfomonile tiedjei]|uniref:1-acyl-sn-glycerol-3-phosphate acyltransferase n=1 Tax=Desulfomonile tiedjei (strain ATCC 49306 / DSM 6799 / DCB-1) TaxID=706587 RepID=I4C754_DESTA|nr:lysophospholipid acyltransferase family protein [Desulfomonile tiedjei]AFM25395.1 1-acyl-sn-glycerol-3-phosphate acyltransferase [Desulfomonile tiedjei DSM 6799]